MDLAVFPWRFKFEARDAVQFPPGKAANVLRGGFGTVFRRVASDSYARIFEPTAARGEGPSGLANQPRPFVIRAAHLDGLRVEPGGRFHFDVHVFLRHDPALSAFVSAFDELGRVGLGAMRGKAVLESVWQLAMNREPEIELSPGAAPAPLRLPLECAGPAVSRLRICFLSPTELKAAEAVADAPEFAIVFARARDRVASLSTLYGVGPLDFDFRALGLRAGKVRMTRCDIQRMQAKRRSSRTGQTHSIGGFVGEADYDGELAEFLPVLNAAEWTGIGRQTVWGKGEIRCVTLD